MINARWNHSGRIGSIPVYPDQHLLLLLLLILPIIQIVRQSRQITSEEGKSVDLEG